MIGAGEDGFDAEHRGGARNLPPVALVLSATIQRHARLSGCQGVHMRLAIEPGNADEDSRIAATNTLSLDCALQALRPTAHEAFGGGATGRPAQFQVRGAGTLVIRSGPLPDELAASSLVQI